MSHLLLIEINKKQVERAAHLEEITEKTWDTWDMRQPRVLIAAA